MPQLVLGHNLCLVDGLAVGEHSFSDLEFRVSPAAGLLGVEGMLGLAFVNRFRSAHFDVATGRLTLELP